MLGGGHQQITIFLVLHPALFTSSICHKISGNHLKALCKHTQSSKEPATSTKTEISKAIGPKAAGCIEAKPAQLQLWPAGLWEAALRSIWRRPCKPQVSFPCHLPACSQELCKDNTKEKPKAKLITRFLAFMIRLFPWDNTLSQGFSWRRIMNSKAKGKWRRVG